MRKPTGRSCASPTNSFASPRPSHTRPGT
jgi:hypothetical protein